MTIETKQRGEHGGAVTNLVVLLSLAALCALVYFARHPILRFLAESWVIDEPAEHADALVVLGDDNFYADRATRAVELYREGAAPIVVASGRRLRPNAGISELIEHDLVERGVPKEKIVRYGHDADSTKGDAEAIAKLARERRWKSVIIVTSNYHARRTRYIFDKVFPKSINVSVAGAKDGDFDPERWWEKRKSSKLFARELAGFIVAMWELREQEKGADGKSGAVEKGGTNSALAMHGNGTAPVEKTRLAIYGL
ncbi:MAG TPA: YdcF family protein [Candidatus Limnocylindrales bacterium]|nr:YdcF family protein [Candidatus Limnocylindrales bacterium]